MLHRPIVLWLVVTFLCQASAFSTGAPICYITDPSQGNILQSGSTPMGQSQNPSPSGWRISTSATAQAGDRITVSISHIEGKTLKGVLLYAMSGVNRISGWDLSGLSQQDWQLQPSCSPAGFTHKNGSPKAPPSVYFNLPNNQAVVTFYAIVVGDLFNDWHILDSINVIVNGAAVTPGPTLPPVETTDLSNRTVGQVDENSCPLLTGAVALSGLIAAAGGAGSVVEVPVGQVAYVDVSTPDLKTLNVYGELVFDRLGDNVISLRAEEINVYGALRIGAPGCRWPANKYAEIVLLGEKPLVLPDNPGTKVLYVSTGGTLSLHGDYGGGPTWVRLAKSITLGSTQIELDAEVGWQVGDRIVIASTDFEDTVQPTETQSEVRTISRRISGTVFELDYMVFHLHYGENWTSPDGKDTIDMRAEVGLLNRNVVIRGDVSQGDSYAQGWGGHVFMFRSTIQIDGVELYHVGQMGVLARYPLHFHRAEDMYGSYVVRSSIHDTFQRCITIHYTDNLFLGWNVAFNSTGHCFFFEDGIERNNTMYRNLGIHANPGPLLIVDSEPSIFWITNPPNHFIENVAVGGKFGFWFSLPQNPIGVWAEANPDDIWKHWPANEPMGKFVGNVAHGARDSCLFLDRGISSNVPLLSSAQDSTSYNPRDYYAITDDANLNENGGLLPPKSDPSFYLTVQQFVNAAAYVPPEILDFTAYKCSTFGMWARGEGFRNYNSKLADCGVGMQYPGDQHITINAVIVGETPNLGSPLLISPIDNRTRPGGNFLRPIIAYRNYDAGGPVFVLHSRFFNYDDFILDLNVTISGTHIEGSFRHPAGALSQQPGPNILRPSSMYLNISMINVDNPFLLEPTSFDTGTQGVSFTDFDGSLTGVCGSHVVSQAVHMWNSQCVDKPDWNARHCPKGSIGPQRYSFFGDYYPPTVTTNDPVETIIALTRLSDNATIYIPGSYYRDPLAAGTNYYSYFPGWQTNFPALEQYLLYSLNHTTPPRYHVLFEGAAPGEWILYAIPYPQTLVASDFHVQILGLNVTSASSKSTINATSPYYWDASEGLFWILMYQRDLSLTKVNGINFYSAYNFATIDSPCPTATGCKYTRELPDITSTIDKILPTSLQNPITTETCQSQNNILPHLTYTETASRDIFDSGFGNGWSVVQDVRYPSSASAKPASSSPNPPQDPTTTTVLECDLRAANSICYIQTSSGIDLTAYSHLEFSVTYNRSALVAGTFVLALRGTADPLLDLIAGEYILPNPSWVVNDATDAWTSARIPLAEILTAADNGKLLKTLIVLGVVGTQFYLDDIRLVKYTVTQATESWIPSIPEHAALEIEAFVPNGVPEERSLHGVATTTSTGVVGTTTNGVATTTSTGGQAVTTGLPDDSVDVEVSAVGKIVASLVVLLLTTLMVAF